MPAPGGNGVHAEVMALSRQVDRLWAEKASREGLQAVVEDVAEVKATLLRIEGQIAAQMDARLKERDHAARERKADRRWMVGTVLTATALVISAMAILLPAL